MTPQFRLKQDQKLLSASEIRWIIEASLCRIPCVFCYPTPNPDNSEIVNSVYFEKIGYLREILGDLKEISKMLEKS